MSNVPRAMRMTVTATLDGGAEGGANNDVK